MQNDRANWFFRHPVVSFLVLANAISMMAAFLAYVEVPWIPAPARVFFEYLAKFGPTLGAVATAALLGGRASMRALLQPLAFWRVGTRWYALVALGPLALWVLLYGLLTVLGSQTGAADWYSIVWFVPFALKRLLIGGGLGEEIGWRGFMLPLLQKRWGPLRATFVLGLFWGLWHAPAFVFAGTGKTGGLGAVLLFTVYCTVLAAYFTWVYNRTGGSLAIAVLFHACLSGSIDAAELLFPQFDGTLWFVLALLVLALPLSILTKLGRPADVPIAR